MVRKTEKNPVDTIDYERDEMIYDVMMSFIVLNVGIVFGIMFCWSLI